jgi:hypothetical protein
MSIEYYECLGSDRLRHSDLPITLLNISLVDAYCVRPESDNSVRLPQCLERIPEIASDLERVAIDENGSQFFP